MDHKKLIKLNNLINQSYECYIFSDFLRLTIMKLHELVPYDSGMFYCGISKDCSYFKPYVGGDIEKYYRKQRFDGMTAYLTQNEAAGIGTEASVYKAFDYARGIVTVTNEPRREFLLEQENFYIVCMRILYQGQFLGEIYLHRDKLRPDFDEEELFILKLLQPHVSTVFHIIHTLTAVRSLETDNAQLSRKGMCLLDHELNLAGGNVTGIELFKLTTVYGSSILFHVKELCEDLMVNSRNSQEVSFHSELLKTKEDEIRIDIYYRDTKKYKNQSQFVIVLERVNSEHILTDYKYKFTKREADIIDGIIQGKNNAQLADVFSLSENTIKTHIKKIYLKVGANNRTELTYLLMLNKS